MWIILGGNMGYRGMWMIWVGDMGYRDNKVSYGMVKAMYRMVHTSRQLRARRSPRSFNIY